MTAVVTVALALAMAVACTAPEPGETATGSSTEFIRKDGKPNVVVFVHGVLGDAKQTWKSAASDKSWPELVAADATLADFDVVAHGFETSLKGKGQTIADLADHLEMRLVRNGVIDNYRQIVFVTHSMGGLVVREFLNRFAQKHSLGTKVPMLYLVSVPSSGSQLAEAAKAISNSNQMLAMERLPENLWLQANQQNWIANPMSKTVKVYCAVETEPTFGQMVVGRDSAIPFCTERFLAIPRNHIDIAKPVSAKDDIYGGFVAAVQEVLLKDKRVVLDQASLQSVLGQLRAGFPLTSYNVRGVVDVRSAIAADESWTVANLGFEPGSQLVIGNRSLSIDVKGRIEPSTPDQEVIRSFPAGELKAGPKPDQPPPGGGGPSPSGEGAPGGVGQPGTGGVTGVAGLASGNLTLLLRSLPPRGFRIALLGQSGGTGGDGSNGGAGSNGTKGTAGVSGLLGCERGGGGGGTGGNGGPGGSAGLGGEPGAGGVLTIVHSTTIGADLGALIKVDQTAAVAGEHGSAGAGGPPGSGGQGGNGSGFCGGGPPGGGGQPGTPGGVPADNRPQVGRPPTVVYRAFS